MLRQARSRGFVVSLTQPFASTLPGLFWVVRRTGVEHYGIGCVRVRRGVRSPKAPSHVHSGSSPSG